MLSLHNMPVRMNCIATWVRLEAGSSKKIFAVFIQRKSDNDRLSLLDILIMGLHAKNGNESRWVRRIGLLAMVGKKDAPQCALPA